MVSISSAWAHDDIKYTVTFANPGNVLSSVPDSFDVYLGLDMDDKTLLAACADPTKAISGWYSESNGGGTFYYDHNGKAMQPYYAHIGNLTLYPKIVDASEISTGVFVNGVEVSPLAGTVSGDGWSYTNRVITFEGDGKTFNVTGTNKMNQVSLLLGGTNNYVFTALDLEFSAAPGNGTGAVDVPIGCKADIKIGGGVSFYSKSVESIAGIHCPTGATVRIWSDIDRGITAFFDNTVTYITSAGTAKTALTIEAGPGAAAIGGCRGEPCGRITIDAVNIALFGGTAAMDIGNGNLSDNELKKRGESVLFLNAPIVATPWGSAPYDMIPRPHNEYGRPLFGILGNNGEVYFVPAGKTIYTYQGTESTWNITHSTDHRWY